MMIGRSIGNYKILEKLNDDKTVEVYKAFDTSLNRNVFVKIVGQKDSSRPEIAEKFRFEAAASTKIAHSCIPKFYSLTEIDGELLLATEFVEGETLARILQRDGGFSIEKAVPVFTQIFECLEYTHKNGVTHGGLKTSEIMLTDAGDIKVLDFGTSEIDSHEVGQQKDIYALAAILYETLTGKSLFDAEKDFESSIPEPVEAVISQALFPLSVETYRSVTDFHNALETAGFTILEGEKTSKMKNAPEHLPENDAPKLSDEKAFAVCAIDFSEDENKFTEKDFNLDLQSADKSKDTAAKSPQKRYKVAGAAILAVIVLHFVWQFSFIQSEKLRAAKNSVIAVAPAKTGNEIGDGQPPINLKNDESSESAPFYDTQNSDLINPEKVFESVAKRQTETKSVPSAAANKQIPESKAERLRRAEKLLTGH